MINAADPRPKDQKDPKDRETEQKILDAARSVFIRRGTAGARMAEIAKEAGVNQALLHYYFRSKERLASAVFEHIAGHIFPALAQTLGADISLDEKIDRLVAVYLDNLTRSPFLPGYLLSELHHNPGRVEELIAKAIGAAPVGVLPPLLQKLGAQIDERVAAGTMRAIAPEQFAVNLISLCIFPFAARPMLRIAFGMDDDAFAQFIEQRKTELPAFFRNALRP
ncbi:MAG: TetR family transcriptional regulator [bacterium]